MGTPTHIKMPRNYIWIACSWLAFGLIAVSFGAEHTVTIIEPDLASSSLEATDDAAFDLDKAETKDTGKNGAPKLEIIKQIRRLNSDGSYTVGYEADDGTFKIESRDVLGNVKGTYGYVDVNGEIKRVSYTAGVNSTTTRSTARADAAQSPDEGVQTAKVNKTSFASTTRRPPSLSYLTTAQSSSTKATVIQAIPKKRVPPASSSERPTYNHYASSPRQQEFTPTMPVIRKGGEPTTTVVYATSVPTNRPPIVIRPTPLPGSYKTAEQIARPEKLEITDHVSKVQISSNRDTSTTKPVTELVDEKESSSEERRSHANFVRRQLTSRDNQEETPEAQQQVIYSQSPGDDSSHVYTGQQGTSRPIFNTPPTRIPSAVLNARSRVAQLQNSINNQPKAQVQQSDKVYVKPPRRRPEAREDNDQSTAEPSSENQFISQQRPSVSVQIVPPTSSRDAQATEEDKRVYRRPVAYPPPQPIPQAYRNREFIRQAPVPDFEYGGGPRQFRIPIPQAYPQQYHQQPQPGYPRYVEQTGQPTEDEVDQQQQYLRETTVMTAARPSPSSPAPYAAGNDPDSEYTAAQGPRGRGRQYLPYASQSQRGGADGDYEQPSHQIPYPQNPYSPYANRPPLPSQYYQHPDRPLTARDFERLLNLLIVRHQQLQRYQHLPPGVNPYLLGTGGIGGGGLGGGPGPYNQFGYQQIPRPPIHNPYDYRRPALYGEFSDQDAAYQQQPQPAADPSQQQQQHPPQQLQQQPQYAGNRLVPRLRPRPVQPYYPGYPGERPEYSEATQTVAQQQDPSNQVEYLPSDIREELLYRMLLLAMQPDQQAQQQQQQFVVSDQQEASTPHYAAVEKKATAATSTTSKPTAAALSKFRKPVRSVQILGEE